MNVQRSSMPGQPLCLFVFANASPGSSGHLRHLAAERDGLRDAHGRMARGLGIEILVEVDPSPTALLTILEEPDVKRRLVALHYSGHAAPDRWLLPDATGDGALFAEGFVRRIAALPALRLVVLNGCSTGAQAASLADDGRAVIGTDGPIADDVAEIFAVRLYHALSRGASVGDAFARARDDVLALRSDAANRLWRMARPRGRAPKGMPWHLAPAADDSGADPDAWAWRLADAARDPLAGLPALPRQPLPESPYRHVERFASEHAEVFFGRGRTIRRIVDALTEPTSAPALVVCAVAGVGKSSLLEAGVVPRLRALNRRVITHRHDPATPLVDGLRACLGLARGANVDWKAAEAMAGGPLVAVIDQVEEALIAAEGRGAVLDELLGPVGRAFADPEGPRGRLVLSLRKSHLAEVREALRRNGLRFDIVFVEPLDRAAVVEIVRGPTRTARLRSHYQLTLEDGLAERIADDLAAGAPASVAPILQIVLTGMWGDPMGRAVHFDGARYDQVRRGGVTLARVFARQLAEAEARVGDDGLVLDVLGFHTTGQGTSAARRADDVNARYVDPTAVVEACVDARLLGRWSAAGDEAEGTRLAHDVWGPLVLEAERTSERPGQRARRILEHRAGDWDAGLAEHGLLDGYDLLRVQAGMRAMRRLTAGEVDLIAASETAAREAERGRRRRLVLAAAAVLVIAVSAVVAAVLASRLDTALAAETAANRETSAALADARALGWLKMAAENADDPTLVAAALAEVPPERRGPEWFQAAMLALDEPIATDWMAADRLIGFAPDGRLALIHHARLELHDLETGRVRRVALPSGWVDAPLAIDEDGALVALVGSAAPGGRDMRAARRLDLTAGDPVETALGEPFPCRLAHARSGRGQWLFGGLCNDDAVRPWLMDREGTRREMAPLVPGDGASMKRRGSLRVQAIDPRRPRMVLCTRRGAADRLSLLDLVEVASDTGTRATVSSFGETCADAALAHDRWATQTEKAALALMPQPASPSDGVALERHHVLAPRFAAGVTLQWSLAFVEADGLALAAPDGSLEMVRIAPSGSTAPGSTRARGGSRLGMIAMPWKAWAEAPSPGMVHDDRIAVDPRGRWLVDHHLGAARVWPMSMRSPASRLAAGAVDGVSSAASMRRLAARLPPAQHPDPRVGFVSVAQRPFEPDVEGRMLSSGPAGQAEVAWADGIGYLNVRPPPGPDGEAPPAWSVKLPTRVEPTHLDRSYRFSADGRWLVWLAADGGEVAVWPATIGAAGDLLDAGRRGCMPPRFYSKYQAMPLDDARAAWAACEAERRPDDGSDEPG